MSASRHKITKLFGNHFFRWHALLLTSGKVLRHELRTTSHNAGTAAHNARTATHNRRARPAQRAHALAQVRNRHACARNSPGRARQTAAKSCQMMTRMWHVLAHSAGAERHRGAASYGVTNTAKCAVREFQNSSHGTCLAPAMLWFARAVKVVPPLFLPPPLLTALAAPPADL